MNLAPYRKFALVIPTLNEEGTIQSVLERVCETLSKTQCDWEVVVVDDSSSDNTARVVEDYRQHEPRVRFVVRTAERGLAGAITHGWSQSDADLVGVIDADLQHPPEVVGTLLEQIAKGADIAIASRYIRPGSMDDWNPVRKMLSRVSVLASVPVQRVELNVEDPLSGFFIVRRECIAGLDFQKTGFKLLLEILAKGRLCTVVEVPFRFGIRLRGNSKTSIMTGLHYALLLCKLSAHKRSSRRIHKPDSGGVNRAHRQGTYYDALLGLMPLLLGVEILLFSVVLPTAVRGHADFRQLYTAGYMVRTGQARRLYDYQSQLRVQNEVVSREDLPLPFIRPAYSALLFLPFSFLQYRYAYLAFVAFNVVLMSLAGLCLRPLITNLTESWKWLPVLLLAGFYPVSAAIIQGQDSIVFFFLAAVSFARWSRNRPFASGFWLGLGFFKFQILLCLLLLFFIQRKWRLVAGGTLSAVLCFFVSLIVVGRAASAIYLRSLLSMTSSASVTLKDSTFPIRMSFMPNIHGLFLGLFGTRMVPGTMSVLTIGASAAVLAFTAVRLRHSRAVESYSIAVTTALLSSYYLFVHDLTVLLLPLVLTLQTLTGGSGRLSRRQQLLGWSITIAFVAPFCDPFIPQYRYLMSIPVFLFWSCLVIPAPTTSTTPDSEANRIQGSWATGIPSPTTHNPELS